jgi:quinol---cytochrome c reductase iron-sulfur subunit, bacillus type
MTQMDDNNFTPVDECEDGVSQDSRRGFLMQTATACCSFVLVTIPAAIGGLFFLDPLLRKTGKPSGDASGVGGGRKDADGFIRLDTTRDAIPDDGTPVAVTVIDDLVDAWNRFNDVPIGSVWLRNVEGQMLAFSSVCPHLGCSVNYRRSNSDFHCPCHTSSFNLNGKKTNRVPPRDMDSLEVVLRSQGQNDPNGSEIWVRYQTFVKAISEKKPV